MRHLADILDYLGLGAPETLAGGSLRASIDGSEDMGRPMFAGRDRSAWGSEGPAHFQRLIRTHEWKYCCHSRGDSQLYDLANDPGETRDRAARSARRKMHAELFRWMKDTGDPRAGSISDA